MQLAFCPVCAVGSHVAIASPTSRGLQVGRAGGRQATACAATTRAASPSIGVDLVAPPVTRYMVPCVFVALHALLQCAAMHSTDSPRLTAADLVHGRLNMPPLSCYLPNNLTYRPPRVPLFTLFHMKRTRAAHRHDIRATVSDAMQSALPSGCTWISNTNVGYSFVQVRVVGCWQRCAWQRM